MADEMTFSAEHMLGNMATASQHLPLIDDAVVRGAVLRSIAQFLELNWACTSVDLVKHLQSHPDWHS